MSNPSRAQPPEAQIRTVLERLKKGYCTSKPAGAICLRACWGKPLIAALSNGPVCKSSCGRVEIDNNVENAIRPTAIGKKNWQFMGEAGTGQRGADIDTVIESCRRYAIDPYAYLRDVLTRLPSMTNRQISEVTPAAWAKAKKKPAAAKP